MQFMSQRKDSSGVVQEATNMTTTFLNETTILRPGASYSTTSNGEKAGGDNSGVDMKRARGINDNYMGREELHQGCRDNQRRHDMPINLTISSPVSSSGAFLTLGTHSHNNASTRDHVNSVKDLADTCLLRFMPAFSGHDMPQTKLLQVIPDHIRMQVSAKEEMQLLWGAGESADNSHPLKKFRSELQYGYASQAQANVEEARAIPRLQSAKRHNSWTEESFVLDQHSGLYAAGWPFPVAQQLKTLAGETDTHAGAAPWTRTLPQQTSLHSDIFAQALASSPASPPNSTSQDKLLQAFNTGVSAAKRPSYFPDPSLNSIFQIQGASSTLLRSAVESPNESNGESRFQQSLQGLAARKAPNSCFSPEAAENIGSLLQRRFESAAAPSVTVVMEGRCIGRGICLQHYDSYERFAKALGEMFGNEETAPESARGQEKCDLQNAIPGYKVAYEDREGDLLLAGDLAWRDFVRVAKRIRLLPGAHVENQAAHVSQP